MQEPKYQNGSENEALGNLALNIYNNVDETQSLLQEVRHGHFGVVNATKAIETLLAIKKFRRDTVFATIHKDVLRHVLIPYIWDCRDHEEWWAVDDAAYEREEQERDE